MSLWHVEHTVSPLAIAPLHGLAGHLTHVNPPSVVSFIMEGLTGITLPRQRVHILTKGSCLGSVLPSAPFKVEIVTVR